MESRKMAALFWDLNDATTPPKTPPLHFGSEFRNTSSASSYGGSPVLGSFDWASSEQVEFSTLNPSRTKDKQEGEWHMIMSTRPLIGWEKAAQREGLQDQRKGSYNSLPRAHFVQPNRESSDFSPYANDFWLNGKDAKNIAQSPRTNRKLHPLTQPGFYSPKIPRSKHCEAAQSTKKSLKGSSSTNNLKEFCALTLPIPCSKTAVLKTSPLCSKPQEVKTSMVKTPPLMRATVSQTSAISNQQGKERFSRLQPREDRLIQNQDRSLFSHNASGKDRQDLSNEDPQIYINKQHLFPERQSRVNQPTKLCLKLREASHDSVDGAGFKPSQGDPDWSCQLQTSPHCSPQQNNILYTQHRDTVDVRNNDLIYIESQVDVSSKNVFGQPRVVASLRAACSPRPVRKSTVVEDLKKLIVMDDTEDSARGDLVRESTNQRKVPELCSSSPMSASCASPSLFSPTPALTPVHLHLQTCQSECDVLPEQAESDLWEHPDTELIPLPSTACELDWNSLVQAAQEYETQRMATLLSEMSPVSSRPDTPSCGTYKIHQSSGCFSEEDLDSDVFIDFPDQLSHLEGMVRRLSGDLLKEKRDKVALLAEVLKLRISNQHLREESLCAVEQLHKISDILNTTPGE
ncbi:uncharacterized protein isoform X3 [Danio rerio]|uniref:Uncharacterized protein isoform X3 n=2 Tax=Danio rerio TaxID=7955 RepID=A0AC58IAX7_DANRE